MPGPDPDDNTSSDYEQFEKEQLAQDRDAAGVDTVGIDDATAQNLVDNLVDADVVTPVPEDQVLVHEPSGWAFDSSTQLAVFHRDWTAGRGTDATGNEISGQKRRRLARMRREQTRGRWRSKAERNLAHGLGEVRRLASALELFDSVRNQACQLFRSAQNEDLLRGRFIENIATASVYGPAGATGSRGWWMTQTDIAEVVNTSTATVRNHHDTLEEQVV